MSNSLYPTSKVSMWRNWETVGKFLNNYATYIQPRNCTPGQLAQRNKD